MIAVPFIGFAAVALLAIGFCTFALIRKRPKGVVLLAGAIALFLLGIGGGTYWMLGRPALATRSAAGLSTRDINGLIPFLIERVRTSPNDMQAWLYLGRAYMTVNDASDAAKAYGRAITVARAHGGESPDLDTAYGEAETAANGAVTDEAAAAFQTALSHDPKDPASRFFLGQARAEHGDKQGAMTYWQALLDETPATSPLHQTLVDRLALLTAQGGGAAPDPKAMVAGLAARLKDNPNDPAGWQRLIRAQSVLGQRADALTSLATARKALANDKDAMAALESEAKELKLN